MQFSKEVNVRPKKKIKKHLHIHTRPFFGGGLHAVAIARDASDIRAFQEMVNDTFVSRGKSSRGM